MSRPTSPFGSRLSEFGPAVPHPHPQLLTAVNRELHNFEHSITPDTVSQQQMDREVNLDFILALEKQIEGRDGHEKGFAQGATTHPYPSPP